MNKKLNHIHISKQDKNSLKISNYIQKIKFYNKISNLETQHKLEYLLNGVKNSSNILIKIISWKDKYLSK